MWCSTSFHFFITSLAHNTRKSLEITNTDGTRVVKNYGKIPNHSEFTNACGCRFLESNVIAISKNTRNDMNIVKFALDDDVKGKVSIVHKHVLNIDGNNGFDYDPELQILCIPHMNQNHISVSLIEHKNDWKDVCSVGVRAGCITLHY